jgi:nicotinamidase-related amidase
MLEPPVYSYLKFHSEVYQSILYGCLTEVCVRKTCFDLLLRGYEVYVVTDAVSSIHEREKEVALENMRDAGAHLVCKEMVKSELIRKVA